MFAQLKQGLINTLIVSGVIVWAVLLVCSVISLILGIFIGMSYMFN